MRVRIFSVYSPVQKFEELVVSLPRAMLIPEGSIQYSSGLSKRAASIPGLQALNTAS